MKYIFFLLLSFRVAEAMSVSNCAVYGVGVLGTSLCRQILEAFPNAQVTGITKTTNRHEDILDHVGGSFNGRFRLCTADQVNEKKYDTVVFCAPPSGFEDYAGAVKSVIDNVWSGPNNGGVFVFTSSGGIYGAGNRQPITENSPVADPKDNPRVARLINAEEVVRAAGGCCLRLAGLYNLQRGPHNFWLTSGKAISGGPEGIINMLHYDDAAGACVAALKAGPDKISGKDFLISDGNPLSRKEICEAALMAKVYQTYDMPEFLGSDDPLLNLGKVYDGSISNQVLNWKPEYESMSSFFRQQQ